VPLAVLASLGVGSESFLKIVEIPAHHGHVAEHGGYVLRFSYPGELFVCPAVLHERLVQPILSIQDIAQVAVETREAQQVSIPLEDCTRLLYRGERFIVSSEGNEALQRAVERAGDVHLPSQTVEQHPCGVVVLQRVLVFPEAVRDVTRGSESLRPRAVVVELVGDPPGCPRKPVCLMQVGFHQAHDVRVQALDDRGIPELLVPAKKARARRGGLAMRELLEQYVPSCLVH
jgi:hypothetical protein